jgi:mitochondrial fission protein ELM1
VRNYAITVPESLSDLAHDVVTENLNSIVDNILDETGWSILIITSEKTTDEVRETLSDYLCPKNVAVEDISHLR